MAGLEPFGHGGDLLTASVRFGLPQSDFLDYSANINPLGPPKRVYEELVTALRSIVHYPDPGHRSFRRLLAEKLGIDEEWILPGNGAAECMALAILALAPRKVGVVYPCFSEYAMISRQYGAEVVGCTGDLARWFKPELEKLHILFSQSELVFIGTPNNPTGILWEQEELMQIAQWTEETGTYLVVDEAFLDFVAVEKQATLLHRLEAFPRVILIRSMTKMYAIPGLRLGYAIAHPKMIRRMKEKQVSWSVNALALRAGEMCLMENEYVDETRQLVVRERSFLTEALHDQLGWQVCPSEANFLLVRCPLGREAKELQEALGPKGILVRNCGQYPGLTPSDFRIAVRERADNQRLVNTIKEVSADWGEGR